MKLIQVILYSYNENHYHKQDIKKQHKTLSLMYILFLNYDKSLQPKAFLIH